MIMGVRKEKEVKKGKNKRYLNERVGGKTCQNKGKRGAKDIPRGEKKGVRRKEFETP